MITKLWLVLSAKQRRDPCSGPPTDSTNYRKCVSNSPSTWLAITTNKTKPFLTGQSWRVLKSGYTAGSPEQGFRHCFADGVNQSLISSARRLPINQSVQLPCAHVTVLSWTSLFLEQFDRSFEYPLNFTNQSAKPIDQKIILMVSFPFWYLVLQRSYFHRKKCP